MGESEEEYIERLEVLLQRLAAKGITIHPKKCSFGLTQVEYTGHLLDSTGLSFSEKKREKVVDFRQPATQKELRAFLGLANYFRNHIKHHSTLVHPLQEMVKNYKPRQPIKWSQELLTVFQKVKDAINACPKLYFLNDISPTYLHTDASDYGVGGFLFQVVDGVDYPTVFLSATFTQEQKN